jgi:CheY-like chemotaxis protein
MTVLLVEDDEFKASDIVKVVQEWDPDAQVRRAASFTSASRLILNHTFELCILDMSLPTFDLAGPGGGGSPQGQGGLEVMRLAKRMKRSGSFVIVTQYPDIEIDRRDVPLDQASKLLSSYFDLNLIDCIHYTFDGGEWKNSLRRVLDQVTSSRDM